MPDVHANFLNYKEHKYNEYHSTKNTVLYLMMLGFYKRLIYFRMIRQKIEVHSLRSSFHNDRSFYYTRLSRLKEFLKWKRALFNTMFSFSFDQNRPVTILDNIQNENWNATSLPATTNRHEQLLLYILFFYRPEWEWIFSRGHF